MNESLAHHALLVLVMLALMLAGGLIEAGRAPSLESHAAAAPIAVAVASVSCSHAR
jgi:hypothetical protein